MTCQDCKGTKIYVGLFQTGPCLTCCPDNEQKIVEQVSTMLELKSGTKKWFQNGKLHRDNDLPAVEDSNGSKKWYQNGKFVR